MQNNTQFLIQFHSESGLVAENICYGPSIWEARAMARLMRTYQPELSEATLQITRR
jgi:hypothetical protein